MLYIILKIIRLYCRIYISLTIIIISNCLQTSTMTTEFRVNHSKVICQVSVVIILSIHVGFVSANTLNKYKSTNA